MVALHVIEGLVKRRWHFSAIAPGWVMAKLQWKTPKVISGLDLMAAVMAVFVLKKELHEQTVFLYIDNEAARASPLSMHSPLNAHA